MEHEKAVAHRNGPSILAYINGFLLSIILTVGAYLLVVRHTLTNDLLLPALAGLAAVQFAVQLICFLHLGSETRPRWKLLAFGFMMTVVAIVVLGSLWIMANLNYHMTPQQVNQYLRNQDGL